MKEFFRNVLSSLKAEFDLKKSAIWFAAGFICILTVFTIAGKGKVDVVAIASSGGMALVLVMCVIATEAYYHFIDVYYKGLKRRFRK